MAGRFVPIKPRIGARATVSREEMLDPAFAPECLEALERHGVLVFPAVHLGDEEQVVFSGNLGEIVPQGPARPDGTRGLVYKISTDPAENPAGAEYLKSTVHFHMDGLVQEGAPIKATLLSPRRLSPSGGQTEFCNVYAAYEDLSAEEQSRCESLRVLHSLLAANRVYAPDAREEERAFWRDGHPPVEHPLVWTHESGRKSLVLGMTVDSVVDLPEDEGRSLIAKLTELATRPELVYRHDWEMGDLLIWDNHGVMHRATPYDVNSGRLMHRTVLRGFESIR